VSIPNPYKVLQVDPEAEREVIEAAYRRLARKYHPDVATGPDAQERMVQINQAWEVLRDPVRRAAVDRAMTRAAAASAREGSGAQGGSQGGGQGGSRTTGPTGGDRHTGQGTSAEPGSRTGSGHQSPAAEGGGPGDRTQRVSPNWSAGRSGDGGGYDPRTMGTAQGEGSAGTPPGNPSGSVLSFGRYSGWSLGEVARVDLEYLEWLDRMPIGRNYGFEIDTLLRIHGRRSAADETDSRGRGLFRRR
jgi:curved DNA-binding protein CbpA